MKVLKWIFVAIVGILLLAVASTFFMEDSFRVSNTQIIKASPEAVYNQLNVLKNWPNWSYWSTLDDKMVTTYNDIPSGKGASYSWKGDKNKVGSGTLTITESNPNYVQCHLVFDGQGGGTAEYIIKAVDGGTELTSAMMSPSEDIFSKLMTRIMMKPMMKKSFKAGAERMDAYLQKNPSVASTPTDAVVSTTTSVEDSISKVKK